MSGATATRQKPTTHTYGRSNPASGGQETWIKAQLSTRLWDGSTKRLSSAEVRKFFIRPVAHLSAWGIVWGEVGVFYYKIVSELCVVRVARWVCSQLELITVMKTPFFALNSSFHGFLVHCEGSWMRGGACSQTNGNQMLPSLPGMPRSLQPQRKA